MPLGRRGGAEFIASAGHCLVRAGLCRLGWVGLLGDEGVDSSTLKSTAKGVRAFIAAGMDGFFTDNPDLGVMAARG